MKRAFLLVCALFCVYMGMLAGKNLPADTHHLVEEKYASWTGVLRVHAAPDALSLLNAAAKTFEKGHPGAYLYIQSLPEEALAAPGVTAPDLVVGPPGIFENGHIIGNHACYIRTDDPERMQLCLEYIALLSAQ